MSDIEQNVRDSLRSYGDSVEVDIAHFDDVVARSRRRSRRTTVAAVSAGLAATVAAVGLVARTDGNTRSIVPAIDDTSVAELNETPDTEPAVTFRTPGKVASLLALGESRVLPPSPLGGRSDPASVWTGEDFLIWGGSVYDPAIGETDLADGAAYNPVANTWTALPAAPIAGRGLAAAVWTGDEMLIWGGSVKGTSISDGAAYNPTTDTWRTLSPFTMNNTLRPTAIWTGNEMIVLDGFNGGNAGAAYNPTTDTWRTVAEPPGRSVAPYPQAVWTGDRAIVELEAEPPDAPIIAQYDPIADSWLTMNPPSIPSGARPALVWTGAELLMIGGGTGPKAAWNPTTDTWRTLASTEATILNNTPVWTGDAALFWNGGDTALAYIPSTDSWKVLAGGALSVREGPATAWADGIFLTWSGFQNNPNGTALGAADGLAWRPDIHGTATSSGTVVDTTPIVTAIEAPTTTSAIEPSPTTPSITPATPATEHQLQVLADAFSMPGRPDFHDVPGGQMVTVESRSLVVNVPLPGLWQYDDLDAQSLAPASTSTSETAARSLLARLGIDTQGEVLTFKPHGPGIEIDLAGCSMLFAENGQIVYAIGPIGAIA